MKELEENIMQAGGHPEGPRTQYLGALVPNTSRSIVFVQPETSNIGYLDPVGQRERGCRTLGDEQEGPHGGSTLSLRLSLSLSLSLSLALYIYTYI